MLSHINSSDTVHAFIGLKLKLTTEGLCVQAYISFRKVEFE